MSNTDGEDPTKPWIREEAFAFVPLNGAAPTVDARTPTPAQVSVLGRMGEVIYSIACNEVRPSKERRDAYADLLEQIHPHHPNHTFLIEGRRGSGKTSVLLTLMQAWGRGLEKPQTMLWATSEQVQVAAPAEDREPERGGSKPRHVVPLRMLDLEFLPRDSSVLLWVTQQFRLVLGALSSSSGRQREPRGHENGDLFQRWDGFFKAAAASSAGSVETRRANLDLESYVFELDETMRSLLDVRRTFYNFMTGLAEEYRDWARLEKQPLFVLGIDSADMNPQRVAELLQVTRALSHPRIAFILTGDRRLFSLALHAHYLMLLRSPLEGLPASQTELDFLDRGRPAAQLAEEMLDKALPGPHRFRLSGTEVDSRLVDDLKKRLSRFQVELFSKQLGWPKGTAPKASLADYLRDDKPLQRELIPQEARAYHDLVGLTSGAQSVPRLCRELWLLGLQRSSLLTDDERVSLRKAVRLIESERTSTERSDALAVDCDVVDWVQEQLSDRTLVCLPSGRQATWSERNTFDFHLLASRSLRARVRSPDARTSPRYLDPLAAGALMLATDVVADHESWRIGRSPQAGTRAIALVRTQVRWRHHEAHLAWPTPDWPAFVDHAQLIEGWNAVLELPQFTPARQDTVRRGAEAAEPRPSIVFALSVIFARLVLEVAARRTPKAGWCNQVNEWVAPGVPLSLDRLKPIWEEVGQSDESDSTRAVANRRWSDALWLFTAGEYGLTATDRQMWAAFLGAPAAGATPAFAPTLEELEELRHLHILRALDADEREPRLPASELLARSKSLRARFPLKEQLTSYLTPNPDTPRSSIAK